MFVVKDNTIHILFDIKPLLNFESMESISLDSDESSQPSISVYYR